MTARLQLNADDFAKPATSGEFRFGVDATSCAAALRRLATAIETDAVLVQDVQVDSAAKRDRFTMHKVTIAYVPRHVIEG